MPKTLAPLVLDGNTVREETGKVFRNLAYGEPGGANATGAIVITTAIKPVDNIMWRCTVYMQLYDTLGPIQLELQGYARASTPFHVNLGMFNHGRPLLVRAATNAGGFLCIVLGDINTVWQYPRVHVPSALIHYSSSGSANDARAEGWTVSAVVTTLTGYTDLVPFTDQGVNQTWVASRGTHLLTNGSGLMGNNTNFSGFTFDPVETHGGGGSFRANLANGSLFSDELIPVDTTRFYRLSGWGKSGDASGANYTAGRIQYFGLASYDADGNSITPLQACKTAASVDTTLAVALNPSDTTITLTDATGWDASATAARRQMGWWPYVNAKGYTYPDYTYTRNVSGSGTWAQSAITGNVITLAAPWAGPALAAGTKVRNVEGSGGTYKYVAASGQVVPITWTKYEGYLGGPDLTSLGAATTFFNGTQYVKLMWLVNYTGLADNNIRWSDMSFSDLSARNLENPANFPGAIVVPGTSEFNGTMTMRALGTSIPNVQFIQPGAGNGGYFQWAKATGGARKAYLGYGTDATLDFVMDNGAYLNFSQITPGSTAVELTASRWGQGAPTFTANLTNQRAHLFNAPSAYLGDVPGRTIANAATVSIAGPPVAGTNMAITNPYALWVQAGASRLDGQVQVGSNITPSAALAQLRLQGAPAGAGRIEGWDRLSLSSGHAYGSFPDPGAGGLYLNGSLWFGTAALMDANLYRIAADVLGTDDMFQVPYTDVAAVKRLGLRVGTATSGYALYAMASINNDGDAFLGQNAYAVYNATNSLTPKWNATHASFGSRMLAFSFSKGFQFFADNAAATADASFTPTERMRLTNDGTLLIGTTTDIAGMIGLPGATTPAAGGILWGTDTALYRSAYGTLRLQDALEVVDTITGDTVTATTTLGPAYAATALNNTGRHALYVGMNNEASARLTIQADGRIDWGPGAGTAVDTNLYRSAAGVLKTDDTLVVAAAAGRGIEVIGRDWNDTSNQALYASNAAATADAFLTARAADAVIGTTKNIPLLLTTNSASRIAITAAGRVDIPGATAAATGLLLGTDAYLYRVSAQRLATDGPVTIQPTGTPLDPDTLQLAASALVGDSVYARMAGRARFGYSNGNVIITDVGTSKDFRLELGAAANLVMGVNAAGRMQLPLATSAATGLLIGGDTNLYRSAADQLSTDDNFVLNRPGFADSATWYRMAGDANPRMIVRADGRMDWGPGTTGTDTNLLRYAQDKLKTDDNFIAALSGAVGQADITANQRLTVAAAIIDAAASQYGVRSAVSNAHAAASTQGLYGVFGEVATSNTGNDTGIIVGVTGQATHNASGSGSNINGIQGLVVHGAAGGGIGTARGAYYRIDNSHATNPIATALGIAVAQNIGAGPITNNIGIQVQALSGTGSSTGIDIAALAGVGTNIGLQVAEPSAGASRRAINLPSTSGLASGGITFGADATLYRYAANVLATDDSFRVLRTALSDNAHEIQLTADVNRRFVQEASGKMYWGDGAGSLDTVLYRSALDTLKTDDAFVVGTDLTVTGKRTTPGVAVDRSIASPAHRVFRNVANYEGNVDVGAIVIQTKITISTMFRIDIRSFLYNSTTDRLMDMVVCGYATTGPVVSRNGVAYYGQHRPAVQTAFNASGELAIILGTVATTWNYPKINVPQVTIGHSAAAEAMGSGWTITLQTDLSPWTVQAAVPDISDAARSAADFTVGRQLIAPTTGVTGGLLLGGDANLYRSNTNELKTDDSLVVAGTAFDLPGSTVLRGLSAPAATTDLIRSQVLAEAQNRLVVQADGRLTWGSGAAVGDTTLYRAAADELKTDDDLNIVGNLRLGNGFLRRYSSGIAGTVDLVTGVVLGEFTFASVSQNVGIFGEVRVQSSGAIGVAHFSIGCRSNTPLESKSFMFSQSIECQVGQLDLKVRLYHNAATGRVVVAATGATAAAHQIGWSLEVVERANYDYWVNNSTLVALVTTGLTEVTGLVDYEREESTRAFAMAVA